MLEGERLEEAVRQLVSKFETVNRLYLDKIAAQIKKIGELNPSSMSIISIMSSVNEDMSEVNAALRDALGVNRAELNGLYQRALTEIYEDPRFERALKETPLSPEGRERVERFTQATARQTAGVIDNLSNTTIQADSYRQAVDTAILAVSSGMGDYQSATRGVIRKLGHAGMQVRYPSGYHRRLDTAVRQNVLDGAKQIAQECSHMIGEDLGFDAVEISAHARSAPDHEPVQGHVLYKEEYELMQAGESFTDVDGQRFSGFPRPIAEWNCMHFATSFSTEYSVRSYTPETLAKFIQDNHDGCTIGDKHYTLYQAGQLMRQIETQIRREKDTAITAEKADNLLERTACQEKINKLSRQYSQVAKAAGIKERRNRMTVDGFHPLRL